MSPTKNTVFWVLLRKGLNTPTNQGKNGKQVKLIMTLVDNQWRYAHGHINTPNPSNFLSLSTHPIFPVVFPILSLFFPPSRSLFLSFFSISLFPFHFLSYTCDAISLPAFVTKGIYWIGFSFLYEYEIPFEKTNEKPPKQMVSVRNTSLSFSPSYSLPVPLPLLLIYLQVLALCQKTTHSDPCRDICLLFNWSQNTDWFLHPCGTPLPSLVLKLIGLVFISLCQAFFFFFSSLIIVGKI